MQGLYAETESSIKIEDLNGTYSNTSKGFSILKNETLWYQFKALGIREKFDHSKKADIRLEVISKNKIRATAIVDNIPIESKVLKGEFKNGCFLINRKVRPRGFPLIIFYYHESVTMLTIDDNDNLRVHNKRLKYGGVFLFLKGKKVINTYDYKRNRDSKKERR